MVIIFRIWSLLILHDRSRYGHVTPRRVGNRKEAATSQGRRRMDGGNGLKIASGQSRKYLFILLLLRGMKGLR